MGDQLDPVSVLVALLTVVLGPALAAVVGPYAVIIIAASTGAGWSLGRREASTRVSATFFFLRINFTALLVTVSAAEIAKSFGVPADLRWMLAPIAILIGGIGDDWPAVGAWLVGRIGKFIDLCIEMRARTKDGEAQ